MIETLLLFLVSLLIVVVVHELGHFIVSKRSGIEVEEFGIGMPPRLWGRVWKGTLYSINALPVGAFVRSKAEDDATVQGSLASKGPWTRLAVYAAGPASNIVLAFILFTAFFGLPQQVVTSDGILVYQVEPQSAAADAGILPGDIIVEAEGNPLKTWGDLQLVFADVTPDQRVNLLIQRAGEPETTISVSPHYSEELKRNVIGITLGRNLITAVAPGSIAQQEGIQPGDTLLGIGTSGLINEASVPDAIASTEPDAPVVLTLLSEGEVLSVELTQPPTDLKTLGLELLWVPNTRIESKPTSLVAAAGSGLTFMVNMPAMIVASIPLMKEDPSVAFVGPIGAGQLTLEAVEAFGLSNLLFIGALISLGIAMFNLIPVPPLDGGGMLVAFIEGARKGRRLSPRAVRIAYSMGTALLITLVVFITASDILRLIEGRGFGI
ncbi:MAG: RIP metalloprotease RseP [Dehalococcoidia bacterium]|nr:RIP metalloprotease RseP [Dehalococcoidia bacterium]